MILRNVKSLKSWIRTCWLLDAIITSSNEVFKQFEYEMGVGIGMLGNLTWETAESYFTVKQSAGS